MSLTTERPDLPPGASGTLDIRPLAGALGAEIRGVSLSGALDAALFGRIEAALYRHKVIFFRGQNHLDDVGQEAFARLFGALVPHPTVPSAQGTDAVLSIDSKRSRADNWHTDVTFVRAYPKVSVLRAVIIPGFGGDTLWANAARAYDRLPQPLKLFAETLRAIHTNTYDYASNRAEITPEAQDYHGVFTARNYETEHPVVRVHPVTGERGLLLGHFIKKFAGLSVRDSRRIFELLQEHAVSEDNVVRWRWRAGDVAIWDNRATQHRAINDYGDEPRLLRRSTVQGDVPVGVDGRESVALIGD